MSVVYAYPVAGKDVSQLHDQLLRAGLAPELVQSDGTTLSLTFPNGTAEAAVDAIVAGHVPQAHYDSATLLRERAPLLRENRQRAAWRRLEAQTAGALTMENLRVAVVALVQELAARDRGGTETA